MRKIRFIVNPVAGKGFGKSLIAQIDDRMKHETLPFDIKVSNMEGAITKFAKDSVDEGYSDVVVVGGDGSVIEAINGIHGSDIAFGIIPAGTGNDFAKTLKLGASFEDYMDNIIEGYTKAVDVGNVNGYKFINVACFGIDGQIIKDTSKIKKYVPTNSAYIVSTVKSILTYKAKRVQIVIDGKKHIRNCILVAVGNGKYIGGGMKVTPDAELDDGMFDICIVNKASKLRILKVFPKIFTGDHKTCPEVEFFRGKHIKVRNKENDLLINADGNLLGNTPAELAMEEKKINVIIP